MTEPPRHRRYGVLALLLLIVAAAAAAGIAVQADRNPQPTIVPYDPLPHW